MTRQEILYEVSWANLNLFSSAIPDYNTKKDDDFDDSIDANNPDNFSDGPDEIEVR